MKESSNKHQASQPEQLAGLMTAAEKQAARDEQARAEQAANMQKREAMARKMSESSILNEAGVMAVIVKDAKKITEAIFQDYEQSSKPHATFCGKLRKYWNEVQQERKEKLIQPGQHEKASHIVIDGAKADKYFHAYVVQLCAEFSCYLLGFSAFTIKAGMKQAAPIGRPTYIKEAAEQLFGVAGDEEVKRVMRIEDYFSSYSELLAIHRPAGNNGGNTAYEITLKDSAAQHITDKLKSKIDSLINYQPMIQPPKPYRRIQEDGQTLITGGYHSMNVELVKGKGLNFDVSNGVLNAANALSQTAFSINEEALNHLKINLDQFKPTAKEGTKEFIEQQTKFELVCRHIETAEGLKGKPFYLPVQFDARGRVYYLPSFSPQNEDYLRALIGFYEVSDGCDRDQMLNNCYAVLASFYRECPANWGDRIKFGQLAVIEPEKYQAKEPFQAFALSSEITKHLKSEGRKYTPKFPLYVDATSSMVQIVSSLLSDNEAMKKSNVIKTSDSQKDSYSSVIPDLIKLVEKSEILHEVSKKKVQEILSNPYKGRKLVKSVFVPMGYGQGASGSAVQVANFMKDNKVRLKQHEVEALAKLTRKAIDQNFPSMKAFKRYAKELVNVICGFQLDAVKGEGEDQQRLYVGIPAVWTVPDGFRCEIFTPRKYSERYSIKVGQTRREITLSKPTKWVNKSKMYSAMPPNMVQSLDACLLRMTVNGYTDSDAGLNGNIAVIHDSFGCEAGALDELQHVVKLAFVEMINSKPLQQFNEAIKAYIQHDVKAGKVLNIPETKAIKHHEVSDYFFS